MVCVVVGPRDFTLYSEVSMLLYIYEYLFILRNVTGIQVLNIYEIQSHGYLCPRGSGWIPGRLGSCTCICEKAFLHGSWVV